MILAGFLAETLTWVSVILGIGMLVFIHELGHFLAAKAAGVKVLAFSLGFGPVLTGFRRGDTHYRLSIVPLGGYVKMSGENELPGGGYAPDDFPAQPVWVRAIIMVAGVVMNGLLALVLFGFAVGFGVETTPPAIGTVSPGSPAWRAGIRAGDEVLRIDERPAIEFLDLVNASLRGETLALVLDRDGQEVALEVTPEKAEGAPVPTIGVAGAFEEALSVREDSPAAAAGLFEGAWPVALEAPDGTVLPVTAMDLLGGSDLLMAVAPAAGPLTLLVTDRPEPGPDRVPTRVTLEAPGTRPRLGILLHRDRVEAVRPGGVAATMGWRVGDRPTAVADTAVAGWLGFVRALLAADASATVRVARDGGETAMALPATPPERVAMLGDLLFGAPESATAVEVDPHGPGPEGISPAAAAGIPTGSRITFIEGTPVATFEDVVKRIAARNGEAVRVGWTAPDGTPGEAVIEPAAYAEHVVQGSLASLPDGTAVRPRVTEVRLSGAGPVAGFAWSRFARTTGSIFDTLGGLLSGRVSKDGVGGPILIAQVTRQSTESGIGRFLWILGVISVNLMVLNILPIPLMDGGQLALLGWEAITGRPPSDGLVIVTQWLGLIIILGLFLFVMVNDIGRLLGG